MTARETEIAEREKRIQLIEARKAAEQQAIAIMVAAEAEKKAAADRAEAVRVAAEADAAQQAASPPRVLRRPRSSAPRRSRPSTRSRRRASARSTRPQHAVARADRHADPPGADRGAARRSSRNRSSRCRTSTASRSCRSTASTARRTGMPATAMAAGGGIADQAVEAALRYRSQAPLIDALMRELGLRGGDLNGMTAIAQDVPSSTPKPAAEPKATN